MSTARQTVEETLTQYNVGMSYEELLGELLNHPVYGVDIASASEEEQPEAIMRVLPSYLVEIGVMDDGGKDPSAGEDPTATDNKSGKHGPSAPSLDAFTQAAINRAVRNSAAERQRINAASDVTEILIEKPYPGDWVTVNTLPTKAEAGALVGDLQGMRKTGVDVSQLLGSASIFIPTQEQIAQLAQRYREEHKTKSGEPPKNMPGWTDPDFNNDEAFNKVIATLNGNAEFEPYIPPKEKHGSGAYAENAWKWRTRGFKVRTLADEAGTDKMEERVMVKPHEVLFWLYTKVGLLDRAEGISLGYTTVRPKSSGETKDVEAVKARLIVKGDNLMTNIPRTVIKEIQQGETAKMTLRSKEFFYKCRVTDDGKFRVTKERITLQWVDAPKWEVKPEFQEKFGRAGGGAVGNKLPKSVIDNQAEALAFGINEVMTNPTKFGTQTSEFIDTISEDMAASKEQRAQALSL